MGALVSGTSYANFSRGLAVASIKCGGKTKFYEEQNAILDSVIEHSQKTMDDEIKEEAAENPEGTIVAFDARYSLRRHAIQCTTSFVGKNGKVLHVSHAIDNQPFRDGNFNGSSSNMESFCVVNGMKEIDKKLKINEWKID